MDINIDPKAARWEVSRLFSFEPVIVFLILISPTGLYARNRKMNSLRAGIGINVHEHYYGLSAGPSQFIEYNREINGYFSAGLSLHTDQARLRYTTDDHINKIGVSLRYMVSPFAYLKWLDWIEIGVGLTYEYRNAMWKSNGNQFIVQDDGETVSYHRLTHEGRHHVGFDFPIRAYIIDSARFELFAFFEIKTAFFDRSFGVNHYDAGLMFGMKF